eukprot:404054_1
MDDGVTEFQRMRNRVHESTDIKVNHYLRQLRALKEEPNVPMTRYSQDEDGGGGDIHLFDGKAKFITKNVVQIYNHSTRTTSKIKSKYFLIATGSRPRTLIQRNGLHIECDGEYILTSDDLLKDNAMQDFPQSILIYGAGVIGCEFATIFSNYGVTKNIILFNEGRDRLIPHEDKEISQFLSDNLQYQSKVTVANNVRMKSMETDYINKRVKCVFSSANDSNEVVYVDKVLVAAGRVSNTDELNLNQIIESDKIEVDDHLRVIGPHSSNIYMCGDALGKWGLVSVAEMESRHCVEYMFGSKNPITR